MNMGRNLEFCIFSPWSNLDGKMIFLLGNFITAKLGANVFRSSTYSRYFKSKRKIGDRKKNPKQKHLYKPIHTTYNIEQTALMHNI